MAHQINIKQLLKDPQWIKDKLSVLQHLAEEYDLDVVPVEQISMEIETLVSSTDATSLHAFALTTETGKAYYITDNAQLITQALTFLEKLDNFADWFSTKNES
ncbi:MAG: hypothetical protein B6242_15295 [Anaerolineaceae bacterium 4572_78]|nr:MAG: hypothetical protein B6242_15295 [Anaerolineaceae bacterium 4572_78]